MSKVKNIQTKVEEALYTRLRHLSEVQGKTIKEMVREAISEYLEHHESKKKNDTLFKLVGSFETKEGNWSERKDWRE
jgi:metal-responsive CopG/Arc/MetJ family transcriptional regulator